MEQDGHSIKGAHRKKHKAHGGAEEASMSPKPKIFITDCEGPVSKNDNAFELTSRIIPYGNYFFALISKYDDVLADIVKKPGYKAGDTLKLILPFLRAYGITNEKMRVYSSKNILLVPGSDETLRFIRTIMPTYIVSTSYEHYISALCRAIDFPEKNAYCTKVDIDKYRLEKHETERLKMLKEEISKMPMIEVPKGAKAMNNLPHESQATIERLDEIFWETISEMKLGRMLKEVNPIGGFEKANAVKEIVEKAKAELLDVIYVGDSITDVDPFKLVKENGGLAVSFNGNQYAIREAEIAVMSCDTVVMSVLAEIFNKSGKKAVICLTEDWDPSSLEGICSPVQLEALKRLSTDRAPKVEIINPSNMEQLMQDSSIFRNTVRGEIIGKLG